MKGSLFNQIPPSRSLSELQFWISASVLWILDSPAWPSLSDLKWFARFQALVPAAASSFFFFGQVALNNSSRLSSTWLFWTNIDQNQDHSGPFVPKVGSPITTTIYGHCNGICYLLRPCWSAELLKACLALILQPRSPTQHHLREWPFWNPICKADNFSYACRHLLPCHLFVF